MKNKEAATAGVGFGCVLAITISWSVNHSILWAILHGVFSWLYVVYFAIFRRLTPGRLALRPSPFRV